jgi:hypothetical protein
MKNTQAAKADAKAMQDEVLLSAQEAAVFVIHLRLRRHVI